MIVNVYDAINNSEQCKKYLEDKEKQLQPLVKQINEIKDNYNDKINKFLEDNFNIIKDTTFLRYKSNKEQLWEVAVFKGYDGNLNINLKMIEGEYKGQVIKVPIEIGEFEIIYFYNYKNITERHITYMEYLLERLKICSYHLNNKIDKNWIKDNIQTATDTIEKFKEEIDCSECDFIIECKYCGKKFIRKSKTQSCCSETCKNKYKAHNKSIIERCEKYGVTSIDDTITLPKVYKKYNGICYICGKKTNINGNQYDDDYPNVEHVKALYNGGTHTWDNVKLACRACNMEKGINDISNEKLLIEALGDELEVLNE